MKKKTNVPGWIAAECMLVNIFLFCMMFRAPKKRWEQEYYDCVVVCGYCAEEDGEPSDMMKSRVDKAIELWKEKKVRYLIMSGGAVHNQYVEAEVMKKYAVGQGVSETCVFEEKQAVSTYHNLQYAARMMKNCGWKDCVVVTNGWHLRKADHYARRAGLSYVMAAADNPPGLGHMRSLWLNLQTNCHMYLNMWKGYY